MEDAKLRGQSLGLLAMMAIQFVLGMILNLFVQLPKSHPGTSGSFWSRAYHDFFWAISSGGGIVLILHVIVAIGLLLAALTLVARAVGSKDKAWLAASIAGAIGVIVAVTNGLAFLGYNNDVNSFVMASGFIVATVAYAIGLTLPAVALSEVRRPSRQGKEPKGLHLHLPGHHRYKSS